MTFALSDLRERPEFFDTVADRIWRAWWEPRGFSLDFIRERLAENLHDAPLPIALVAHRARAFLGTASVIASDLEDFPHYTPWVAAVWTEPDARGRGVGRAMVARATEAAFALGYDRAYLCALPLRHDFYVAQGWTPLQYGIGERGVTLFVRDRLDAPPAP